MALLKRHSAAKTESGGVLALILDRGFRELPDIQRFCRIGHKALPVLLVGIDGVCTELIQEPGHEVVPYQQMRDWPTAFVEDQAGQLELRVEGKGEQTTGEEGLQRRQ